MGFYIYSIWQIFTAESDLKALLNITVAFGLIILGIGKPGLLAFLKEVYSILNDQKTSLNEKVASIREAVQKLTGLWVDLSILSQKEEKKLEEKKIEEIKLL